MSWKDIESWAKEWWLLVVPGTVACGAVIAYAVTFHALPLTENPVAWGTFGDYMGGLMNPLVSVLTLFVAISVWRLQKVELEKTKKAMESQAKTSEQQRREQRFFDLLNLYHTTVQSIATGVRDTQTGLLVLHGKEAIARLVVDSGFRSLTSSPRDTPTYLPANQMTIAPEMVQQMGRSLDHFFRVVFTFLREAEVILGDDNYRYVKLFRAQLSLGELEALSLTLIFDSEGKKLQPLIERYGILKHLQNSQLRRLAEEELHPKSFGRRFAETHQSVLDQLHAA